MVMSNKMKLTFTNLIIILLLIIIIIIIIIIENLAFRLFTHILFFGNHLAIIFQ